MELVYQGMYSYVTLVIKIALKMYKYARPIGNAEVEPICNSLQYFSPNGPLNLYVPQFYSAIFCYINIFCQYVGGTFNCISEF